MFLRNVFFSNSNKFVLLEPLNLKVLVAIVVMVVGSSGSGGILIFRHTKESKVHKIIFREHYPLNQAEHEFVILYVTCLQVFLSHGGDSRKSLVLALRHNYKKTKWYRGEYLEQGGKRDKLHL